MAAVEPRVASPAPGRQLARRLVTGGLAVIALVMIGYAFSSGEGDNTVPVGTGAVRGQVEASEAVERLVPSPNDLAVRQDEVGVDLKPGFSAELSIDGTAVPKDQLTINEPLAQFFYRPGEGKEIERFAPGQTCVTATISNLIDPAQDARVVEWCFGVA